MVSALDSESSGLGSSTDQGTELCFWARHLTLIVPLFIQMFIWVPVNLLLGSPCNGQASNSGGSRTTSSRFMLRKPG